MITRKINKEEAFTIVELLTVMSIIVILISILVPSLGMVRRYAKKVRQKAQFHSIDVAMDLFNHEWEGYPDSVAFDSVGVSLNYCGALKLCEAMAGQDLMGFHPQSRFTGDLKNNDGEKLYYEPGEAPPTDPDNLKVRRGPYLQLENANAYRLREIYGSGSTTSFDEDRFVLCDVYSNVKHQETGRKIGMPILYYKANVLNAFNNDPCVPRPIPPIPPYDGNIYDFYDDNELVALGKPWDPSAGPHELWNNPSLFYEMIRDKKIDMFTIGVSRPYRADSYILLSAGFDGEYGTPDDVFNFEP